MNCWRVESAFVSRALAMKSIDANRRFKIARLDMSRSDDSACGQHVQHGLYLPSAGPFAPNVMKRYCQNFHTDSLCSYIHKIRPRSSSISRD